MKIECCICLEEFAGSNERKILTPKCGHLFHENCLNDWLSREVSCPQCRLTVTHSDLHQVFLTDTSRRRSSIFNSSLCQNYREVQDDLMTQQENNRKEMADLKVEVEELKKENGMLKEEVKALRSSKVLQKQPSLIRQSSAVSYKNVESIVAKTWKKNN